MLVFFVNHVKCFVRHHFGKIFTDCLLNVENATILFLTFVCFDVWTGDVL